MSCLALSALAAVTVPLTEPLLGFVASSPRHADLGSAIGTETLLLGIAPPCRSSAIPRAAKKRSQQPKPIMHRDIVYIRVHTGRYIGELDGTTKLEWVKARGIKKDPDHALMLERTNGDGPVESGDTVLIGMPTGVHIDILGPDVRARHYDPEAEWQDHHFTIIKQEGGLIYSGDKIFLRGHEGNYLDANPLEKAPDGELKARWPDEGDWQMMWIET